MPGERIGNNISFEYYNGPTLKARNAVKNTVEEFVKKAGSNGNFINGFTFSVVETFKDLKPDTPFKQLLKTSNENTGIWGASNPTEIDREKGIVIQTFEIDPAQSIFSKNMTSRFIESTVMHEIGHCFDDYYGPKDKDLIEKVRKFHMEDDLTSEEEDILIEYHFTKDLSDSNEYKQAWRKDVTALGKDEKTLKEFLNDQIKSYYTPDEIDISDGVSLDEVELADHSRSEVFAQLFAYALGKDDGNKDEITKVYKNTYKVVKSYVKKYLKVNPD